MGRMGGDRNIDREEGGRERNIDGENGGGG